jgi:uncharacterized protein (DUF2062 family)
LRKALSVAFGIFMGIVPIWGFQLIVGISLAVLFRLNKALVIIAANISIPPMIPLIIFLSYKGGAYWVSGQSASVVAYSKILSLKSIENNFTQYLYGSITLAVIAGLTFGSLTFILLKLLKRQSPAG